VLASTNDTASKPPLATVILNARTGRVQQAIASRGSPEWAAMSADGAQIAIAAFKCRARIYDVATGKRFVEQKGGGLEGDATDTPHWVDLSPDGALLFTLDGRGHLRRSNAADGTPLTVIDPPLDNHHYMSAAMLAPSGRILASVRNNLIRLWDVGLHPREDYESLNSVESRDAPLVSVIADLADVSAAQYSADGRAIVTLDAANVARVWNAEAAARVFRAANAVAMSSDGTRVALGHDRVIEIVEVATGRTAATIPDNAYYFETLVLSADGTRLVATRGGGGAQLWDARSGAHVGSLPVARNIEQYATFSPDGTQVLTGDGTLWNARSGTRIRSLDHTGDELQPRFSWDGRWITTAPDNRTLAIWDAHTGQQIARVPVAGRRLAVTFSPDGRTLATATGDRKVRLWSTKTWTQTAEVAVPRNASNLAFSPDGTRLVAALGDWRQSVADGDAAIVWDVESHRSLFALDHDAFVSSATWTSDGARIITFSNLNASDYTARVWDARTGNLLDTLPVGPSISLSADGTRLASAVGSLSFAAVWNLGVDSGTAAALADVAASRTSWRFDNGLLVAAPKR